jgi:urate oxidase / 2-oxo-4-hydroxy-4-carboxy-5-ureidoimidazoline decarboxylase
MKNFVYATAADFDGRSLESYVMYLGRRLLDTYPQMERIRVTAQEVPVDPAHGESDVVFRMTRGDVVMSHADFERSGTEITVSDVRSGLEGMRLLKTTGSSFEQFARDRYTSLPELTDRPLTIRMDVHWRYGDVRDVVAEGKGDVRVFAEPRQTFGKIGLVLRR